MMDLDILYFKTKRVVANQADVPFYQWRLKEETEMEITAGPTFPSSCYTFHRGGQVQITLACMQMQIGHT
jgi:hypothetical protein